MTLGDGWESQLITGLAELLAANSIGAWRPTGVYVAGEIAIVHRAVPPQPDQLITLATYPASTGPSNLADITVGVQVRIRGTTDPRSCDDIGAAVFDLLDSSGMQVCGTNPATVSIVDVYRQSAVSLGQDAQDRWEASHNYYVEAMRPTIHRTD